MELLAFLIVIGLILGFCLGVAGFFMAQAAGHKITSLQQQLQRLNAELNDTRALSLKLHKTSRADEQSTAAPDVTETHADDPEPEQSAAGSVFIAPPIKQSTAQEATPAQESVEPKSAEEKPAKPSPETLQHLLALRKEQQAQREQAGQAETEQAMQSEEAPVTEKPEAVIQERTASDVQETLAADVTRTAPNEPSEESPTRRLTIEEVLAGKVFVWIGAIALVLTAAFLLKLGFDSGIITEPVRVIAAAVFGIALWCVGEWARSRVSLIAQALCGAAVAVLYASVLAGHNLYGLFGPNGEAIAFGLMATITAAAILLSLRHGPAVAILGMLGGFMLPPVLAQGFGGPTAGMVLYLIAIEIGVLAVTGKRGWFGISLMTLIFSVTWSIGYTLIGDNPTERTLTAMLVLGTAAAYIFHTARIHRDASVDNQTRLRVLGLSIAATCSAIGVVALLSIRGDYSFQDLSMLGIVALGTLILARIDARQIAMPFVAMALSFFVLFTHALKFLPAPPSDTFIAMSASFGGLFLLGGYACMWGSVQRKAFALMCAIAGPAFYGLVIFAGHDAYELRAFWWPYTLCLAGAYAIATLPMLLRREAAYDWPIALFSVFSFALICITLGQSLDHPYFAVSLAIVSAIAALIDLGLFIRPLRLAGCIVAFASAGILLIPGPFDLTIHGSPIFNTLLPMYLIPAAAFAVIAWAASRAGSKTTAQNLTWLSMGTLTVMLLTLTRNIFQPEDFATEQFKLYEWSTYATVLLLAGFVAQWIGNRLKFQPILQATQVIVGLGGIIGLIGGLLPSNPLFNNEVVGGKTLAAGLLALYAAPAALMWLWSRRPSISEVPQLADALRVGSITLVTLFVGLQIRNGFAPDGLRGNAIGLYELITYTTAWLLMGGFIQRLNQKHLHNNAIRVAGQVVFGIGLVTTLIGSVIFYNPLFDKAAVGGWDLSLRMAVLFALPAALMWLWSRGRTLADQPTLIATLRGTSIAYLAIFFGILIRNAYQTDDIHALTIGMFECTTYGLAWAGLGYLLHFIAPRCTLPQTTGNVGRTVFGVGLVTLLLGNVLVLNPLWFRETVGNFAVFNGLWYLYGPLIMILALIARMARKQQLVMQAKLAGFLAVGLSFMLLSMLVRHGFSGDGYVLITSNLASAERYAYSLAWVVFGGVLLVAGVFTRLDTLRYGSLAVLLLAVGKVFLIDTANLENLYRVFSFFGLGVTLIGLGYLYQRLVFKRPNPTHKAQAA